MTGAATDAAIESEVAELHRFFEQWFAGDLPATALARLDRALAPGFTMVTPDGATSDRAGVILAVRSAHGCAASGGPDRIRVRDVRVRHRAGAVALATYEEWQRSGGVDRGRLSSALFATEADGPNGVRWLHLHETWLET